jgi:hypothetical protein
MVSESSCIVTVITASLKEDERGGQDRTSESLLYQPATWHRAVNAHCFTRVIFRFPVSFCLWWVAKPSNLSAPSFAWSLVNSLPKPLNASESFAEHSLCRRAVFEWHSCFKAGRMSVEGYERPGRPSTSKTTENAENIRELIHEDSHRTIHELADTTGKSCGICLEILTEILYMRCIAPWSWQRARSHVPGNHRVCDLQRHGKWLPCCSWRVKKKGSLYTFPRRLFWRRWQPKLNKLSQYFFFDQVNELSDTPHMYVIINEASSNASLSYCVVLYTKRWRRKIAVNTEVIKKCRYSWIRKEECFTTNDFYLLILSVSRVKSYIQIKEMMPPVIVSVHPGGLGIVLCLWLMTNNNGFWTGWLDFLTPSTISLNHNQL